MIGAALQRVGIALVLVGGVDKLSKAAAWESVGSNILLTVGLLLAVIGLLVTVAERLTQSSETDSTGEVPAESHQQ